MHYRGWILTKVAPDRCTAIPYESTPGIFGKLSTNDAGGKGFERLRAAIDNRLAKATPRAI